MTSHRITLLPTNWSFTHTDRRQSILQSALASSIRLPNSCRNGTCRTCMCKLVSGSIDYQIEWPGLSRDEKAEGWILPCVAAPTSDLVLDVPLAIDLTA